MNALDLIAYLISARDADKREKLDAAFEVGLIEYPPHGNEIKIGYLFSSR